MVKVDWQQLNKPANDKETEVKKKKQPATGENIKDKELLEAERVFRAGVTSVRELIAPSSMEVKNDYIRLDQKYVRTIFVTLYPRFVSLGWFAPIINLNAELDVAMYFYPIKSSVVLRQLKNRVGSLEAEIYSEREKGAPRDPIKETALLDIESLRDNLTQGVEKFFQFALYITFYADSEDKLNKLGDEIEGVVGSKLIVSKKALYQAEQGFNSTLPIGNDELIISCNMNSSPAASSFPFISSDLTSNNGILYGINRHNNS
ncbi:MAG: conjugal transfer protein TraC, partial [Candidatus Komeilibacteria bacterium CG_4_9_14_3_um_filter_37_5]